MPITKLEAYNQAAVRARSGATTEQIIADADRILNYVNGTVAQSCASAAPKPSNPRRVPAIRYVAEYTNKASTGTHLGKKLYDTYSGAAKNGRSRRGTLASRFVKVVTLKEAN